jgi:UDP-glucose 4-epimerase
MNIIVFGGSGFLGSHVADALSGAGNAVTIFDCAKSPWLQEKQGFIEGDILDYSQVRKAVQGMDYVYHLAGVADIGRAVTDPIMTLKINVTGSIHIIEACKEEKVKRLLFASSLYVYSQQGSFYRVSKQAVESIIEAYSEQYGMEYTILRYGSLYGPRAQDWNGLKSFIVQAVRDRRIVYPGNGEERREYIHVKDAADLSVRALESEFTNQCLTLTGTQILSTKDVMKMIQEIIGQNIDISFSTVDPDFSTYHYSLTPYRYNPKRGMKIVPTVFVDLGQGILDMVEDVESQIDSTNT